MKAAGQITGDFGDPAADDFYLRSVRPTWRGLMPTREQFVSAAMLACDQMAQGVERTKVKVVQGSLSEEDTLWNNANIGQFAAQVYCIEYYPG
jgi:uncharacterized membrane protein